MGSDVKMNLSFAGCGFLGIYHVGVAVCFKKYAPHFLLNKISGASAGGIAACCLLCDLPIGEVASDMLSLIREARRRTLGPFSPSFNVQEFLHDKLNKVLPDDAHLRVSGKLHISLTRVYDGKNVIVSQFSSKEELLQALAASSFVPVFSGFLPPKFQGERYMDGGFSDNLPTLDENTITVSPFCGESDICPRDSSTQLFNFNVANTSIEFSKQNIYRFMRILWPPKPEVLSNMCKQGFDDALRFLQRNNLINCTRCLAVQSTFVVSENLDESCEYDPQCQECKMHRQEALVANLPDTVVRVFQDAIDSANKGLYNWMLSHRSMKLITLLSVPYTIPADFALATVKKLVSIAPHVASSLVVMNKFILEQIIQMLVNSGQAKTQNSYSHQRRFSTLSFEEHHHDKEINFNFKFEDSESDRVVPSRRNSLASKIEIGDDTFENILQVTSHHDAVMAFYYMDENNKVKVTEIFDVTDSQTISDDESSIKLDEESLSSYEPFATSYLHASSLESVEEEKFDYLNILSDPESDWSSNPIDGKLMSPIPSSSSSDDRPECEQS